MGPLMMRYARQKDALALHEIEKACFPAKEASSLSAFEERIRLFPEGQIIGEVDDHIIGFISAIAADSDHVQDDYFESMDLHEMNGRSIIVLSLAVSEDFQRMGIARKLMAAFIEEGKNQGRKKIILTCKAYLIQYYERMGFINIGQSESQLGDANWFDLVMELKN